MRTMTAVAPGSRCVLCASVPCSSKEVLKSTLQRSEASSISVLAGLPDERDAKCRDSFFYDR